MADQDVVFQTAAELGILGKGETPDERRQNAARLTRIVAWRLRDRGWGNIRHETPSGVNGRSADKIMHRGTLQGVDIVRASEDVDAAPQWAPYGLEDAAKFLEPIDEPAPPPPPPPPPGDLEARVARLEERYAAGLEACARLIDFSLGLLEELRQRG